MKKTYIVISMILVFILLLKVTDEEKTPLSDLNHVKGSRQSKIAHSNFRVVSPNIPAQDVFQINAAKTNKTGWELIWNDEFSGNQINEKYWTLQNGGGIWGNNELQYYTDRKENSPVSEGKLRIKALKEDYKNYHYTSARIVTKGKLDFLYGKLEIRAKLPNGKGLFPAIWLLPSDNNYNSYKKNGEIDIVEMLGNDPYYIYAVAHFLQKNNMRSYRKYSNGIDFSRAFHVYSIEWDPYTIKWMIDNEVYHTFDLNRHFDENYHPFNKKFYLILNLAVGGDWPGYDLSKTSFPAQMEIDYVRYYQFKNGE